MKMNFFKKIINITALVLLLLQPLSVLAAESFTLHIDKEEAKELTLEEAKDSLSKESIEIIEMQQHKATPSITLFWFVNNSNAQQVAMPLSDFNYFDAQRMVEFKATYSVSGGHGNELKLLDTTTNTWSNISGTSFTKNGVYTITNLKPNTSYMIRYIRLIEATDEALGYRIYKFDKYFTLR